VRGRSSPFFLPILPPLSPLFSRIHCPFGCELLLLVALPRPVCVSRHCSAPHLFSLLSPSPLSGPLSPPPERTRSALAGRVLFAVPSPEVIAVERTLFLPSFPLLPVYFKQRLISALSSSAPDGLCPTDSHHSSSVLGLPPLSPLSPLVPPPGDLACLGSRRPCHVKRAR